MAAVNKPLNLEQGVSYTFGFTMFGPDRVTPVDLTGCTAALQVRITDSEPTPLISLSTTNSRIVLGGVAGTVTINFEPADTLTLTVRSGVYDLFLYWPSGAVWRLFKGVVSIERSVTRA
jgi:hypothetical protein